VISPVSHAAAERARPQAHTSSATPPKVDARRLRAMLADGRELALVDVREELNFSQHHLLLARSVPLSRFELKFAALVPRRATRVVLCDDGDGLVERAAAILLGNGYADVAVLDGGVAAWREAGFELFSGVNVPSKAFGEFVEHSCGTPSIAAEELEELLRTGADVVVLDSRPLDEYVRVSIPTAVNVPGAELVLRARELAPSPRTTVVVNCAGRTRSIIGAQSLINAGLPNRVLALRNGTMGWSLAGFPCDSGQNRRAPGVSADNLQWARQAAMRVAESCGVKAVDRAAFERLRTEQDRTLYVFDVRDPVEYENGHVAGAVSAPGGQLVQATDQYVGTLGARIVLVDDAEVRALMTASWLHQMGWQDVFVLAEAGTEVGRPATPVLEAEIDNGAAIELAAFGKLFASRAATVVDLSLSRDYLKEHIPGAWFAIRTRLDRALKKIPLCEVLVLSSEDGALAAMAVAEAQARVSVPVRFLAGGNAAWRAAGFELSAEPLLADELVDQWRKPYERVGDAKAAMREYLAWEIDLLARIERDGLLKFTCVGR
jgi:rhodanese-related sulfurtransferase